MSGIREYILRLCIGGICCAVASHLSGSGAKREITRFSCTCIMLLLCFSGIKEIDFTAFDINGKQEIQIAVDDAINSKNEFQQAEVDNALATYIQEQALAMGCICQVKVQSYLENGEYQIQMVMISTDGAMAHPELQSWIITTLKIKGSQIRWEDTK